MTLNSVLLRLINQCCWVALMATGLFYASNGNAQNSKWKIQAGLELGLPTGNFSKVYQPGKGILIKGLLSVKSGDQFTFQTSYTDFNIKNDVIDPRYSSDYTIVPVLFGYRRYIQRFYSETQIGTGIYTIKVSGGGQSLSKSETNFTWAQTFGFNLAHFDCFAKYQQGNLKNAGVEKLTMIGVGIVYQLSFSQNKRAVL